MVERYQVAVMGGGPGGTVLAIVAARAGLQVGLFERSQTPLQSVGECLPPAAVSLLEKLDLADVCDPSQHLVSHGNRAVWGTPEPVERNFLAGLSGPGRHLDRRRFQMDLNRAAICAGVRFWPGVRFSSARTRQGKGWEVECFGREGGGSRITADFLVDATGRPSLLARSLSVRRIYADRLVGLAAELRPCDGRILEDSFALVESVEHGWWYSALLPSGNLAVVYFTDRQLVRVSALKRVEFFQAKLCETAFTIERANLCEEVTSVLQRPAETSCLQQICGPGWLATGDAAFACDPLSSNGIATAIGSGYYAARAIGEVDRAGAMGAYQTLMEQALNNYLLLHRTNYRAETRWPESPFWKVRHQGLDLQMVSGGRDAQA